MDWNWRKSVGAIAVSGACIACIAFYEGFVDHTYNDAVGVKTIGYGHTGSDVKANQKVTRTEARALLVKDADAHWKAIRQYIKVPLYQYEADAFTSLAYNIGVGNFRRSSLLKKLNKGDYAGACKAIKSWVYAGGKKLPGLVKRREAEYRMCIGEQK